MSVYLWRDTGQIHTQTKEERKQLSVSFDEGDQELILGTLAMRWEYTLQGTTVNHTAHALTHTMTSTDN